MLPKKNRVPRRYFSYVVEKGRTYHSPYFTLRIASSYDEKHHFSFVVSKKIAQKAVSRNLIRRRCYEAVWTIFHGLKIPAVGIFYIKKDAVSLKYQGIKEEIQAILCKSGILRE